MADRMDRNEQDLVVAPGQFAFLLDYTKGNVDVLVGPTKTSLSATDYPVVWNRYSRVFESCTQAQAKQQFYTAAEGYYIVVENPALDPTTHPTKGTRNSAVELAYGKKVNIPGPVSFALFPGQSADVIEGHHLRSNQYLLVRVYNDVEAQTHWHSGVVKKAEGGDGITEAPPSLHMGQLLVIKGTDVSFYIPPTGVEVLQEETGRYVREAETLERLEFCILLNESGDKRYVIGPDVVFPEPTETFVKQAGARKGRAIELNEISGVYVKVIAAYAENGRQYTPGDELFITGREHSLYYPRPEHSLIQYGNRVVHYAVAIPEGEGRYVLNRKTGEVRIERGPSMFLPDPRDEVIVRRILSDTECTLLYPHNTEALRHNQMLRQSSQVNADTIPMAAMSLAEDMENTFQAPPVAYAAPAAASRSAAETLLGGGVDTMKRQQMYTPPRTVTLDTKYDGVVSVDVWTGYAALLVRKNGARRVVVGPKTVLLEYDERPVAFELSTGVPKTDAKKITTGFLRVINNSVSDRVRVETSDTFSVDIHVRYHVNFVGDTPESWFDVENYVQFLVERIRSIIRREAKKHTVRDMKDNAIDILRNLILGGTADGGRVGRTFPENNMHVFDLDVETPTIDDVIDALLCRSEQTNLRQALELAERERELAFTQRLQEITRLMDAARLETERRLQELQYTNAKYGLETSGALETKRLQHALDSQDAMNKIRAEELARDQKQHELEIATFRSKTAVESEALTQRALAITPQLAEVLQRLGDEAVLQKLTEAVAPLAILGGDNVASVLQKIFADTPVVDVLTRVVRKTV